MNVKTAIKILNNAIRHVPYYRSIAEKTMINNVETENEFTAFPMLKKSDINNNISTIVSDEYNNKKIKQLRTERTSGSTGKYLEILWNPDEYHQSNLSVWRMRKKWYGISPFSKCLSFSTMEHSGSRVYRPEELKFDYTGRLLFVSKNMLENDSMEMIDSITEFEPEWLNIQPSSLIRFTEIMKKSGKSLPSLRYIELLGEMVMPSVQKSMEEFWHVPVANMYGAAEVNTIAFECPYHRLHVLENNVYLEPYENDGKPGILVTGLHNSAMPIIRYYLEDELTLHHSEKCQCGLESSFVTDIKGRTTDVVLLEGDRYANPYVFVFCINQVNSILNNPILQFKIVQTSISDICFYLVLDNQFLNWKNTIREELLDSLNENCNELNMSYTVCFEDEIKSTGNKFKFFEINPDIKKE